MTALIFTMPLIAQVEQKETAAEAQGSGRKLKIVTESQTANYIPKFDGVGTGTVSDSLLYEKNGNIGIGTIDPKTRLHLYSAPTSDVFAGMGTDPALGPAMNFGYAGNTFGRGAGFFNVRPDPLATAPNPSLRFMTVGNLRMIIANSGVCVRS